MREILFRGKRIDNGRFVIGFYVQHRNAAHYILDVRYGGYEDIEGGCFELRDPECDMYECLWYEPKEMTVLGNIHDNPEMLKGGA